MKTVPEVLFVKLSENEQQVLLWLLHHPLQRISDIAVGLDITKSTIARILQKFSVQDLVEQITPALGIDSRHGWHYLSSSGITLIANHERVDPTSLARAWQANERHLLRLLPRLHQIIHLQNIVHSLISHAPTALAYAGYQAEIRWGWQREYPITFRRQKQIIHCKTDAVVVFRRRAQIKTPQTSQQEQFFTLFVYLDLGKISAVTSRATMIHTFRNLLLYRESRERQPYRSMFPLIMIVVESSRQLELWQQAAMETARYLHIGKPLLAVIVNQSEEPRPKSRSIWHYHWRVLSTNAFCRLEQMMQPMRAAAVPPGMLTNRVALPDQGDPSQSHSRPVEGHYQRRMENLLHLPHIKQGRPLSQEREIVALLSLQMSDRYREILMMLYTNPLFTIEELAVLSNLHSQTASRYVFELERWGYLERFHRPRGKEERKLRKQEETRWALSARGLLYLGASTARSMNKLYQKGPATPKQESGKTPVQRVWQRGVGQLYREWKHTAGIYRCLIAFCQATAQHPQQSIAWFETHFRCARHYQINKRWYNFRPDVVLEYVLKQEHATRRFHLWIEWDEGTMGSRALREKWQTYRIYLRSLEWRARMSAGVLPILLIIVPGRQRLDHIRNLVQEVFGNTPSLHVRITTRDLLYMYGPLSTIWTEIIPITAQTHLRALMDLVS